MGKFLVTGASGYLAGRLIGFLSSWEGCDHLVGLDIKTQALDVPDLTYHRVDIRSGETEDIIKREAPDVIIHLAYVVDFLRDTRQEQSVNLGGLRRVLAGAGAAGCRQLLVASSTAVYGAYPGIATFQDEKGPLHIHPRFPYPRDKILAEVMLRNFSRENPEIKVTVIRPAIVVGPNWGNFWTAFFFLLPVIPRVVGHDTMYQFIHEDDFVQLWRVCIEKEAEGTFNAAADGALTTREIARILGKPLMPVHRSALWIMMWLLHHSHLLPIGSPPSSLDFCCYPWVAGNTKARQVLGFAPEHDSREAFELAARSRVQLLENLGRKATDGYRIFNAILRAEIARAKWKEKSRSHGGGISGEDKSRREDFEKEG